MQSGSGMPAAIRKARCCQRGTRRHLLKLGRGLAHHPRKQGGVKEANDDKPGQHDKSGTEWRKSTSQGSAHARVVENVGQTEDENAKQQCAPHLAERLLKHLAQNRKAGANKEQDHQPGDEDGGSADKRGEAVGKKRSISISPG